jgi:hypothetical protein
MVTPEHRLSATIPRQTPLHPALDFQALKDEAVSLTQSFAGEEWTDYNAHDPGITIIEQLCYALTDLAYRAELPIADLLAGRDGAIPRSRYGPHSPWRALATQPVTVKDFRRLLLDRVVGLGNVWLTPRTGEHCPAAGLYDIQILPAANLPGADPEPHRRHRATEERVRRMFLHHRPLCEDIGSVRVLQPLRTVVSASLHLDRTARPEAVMAEAIYRLSLAMAPEPRRRDFFEVAPGASPADLFEGPLPLSGFIPASELAAKPEAIEIEALADRLLDIPGVVGVHEARLWVQGAGVFANGSYAVQDGHYCSLDAGLGGTMLPLECMVGGRRCVLDRDDVLRRLVGLWERHRRRFPLKSAYRQAYPMPRGRHRALEAFTPLATQFPRVYGLGDGHGRPASAAAAHLLGFLAIFEMLMVDYCDRLADVRGLLEGKLVGSVPIGAADFRARIPALAHLGTSETLDDDIFARLRLPLVQQESLIDFLLTLYGEDAGEVPLPPSIRPGSDGAARHRIAIKHSLLGHLAALARRRGRGADYRSRPAMRRLSGIELRARILLGDHEGGSSRRRLRIAFVEHMMLRPRSDERLHREAGRERYGMTVSAVIHLNRQAAADADYRQQVTDAIRHALPAHIALHVHFVDRARWRRFRRLHRLWTLALRLEERRGIDWFSIELQQMLAHWARKDP